MPEVCGISAGAWVKYEGRCEHISNTCCTWSFKSFFPIFIRPPTFLFLRNGHNHSLSTESIQYGHHCKTKQYLPIGSMYGIYANIGGILMVNVTIYSIHGSYGLVRSPKYICVFRCSSVFMSCFLPRLWPIPGLVGLVMAHLGRHQHCRHGRKPQQALPQPST